MRRNGCGEVLAVIEHGRRVARVLTLSTAGIVEIFGVSGIFRVTNKRPGAWEGGCGDYKSLREMAEELESNG